MFILVWRTYLFIFPQATIWIGANYDRFGGVGRHVHAIKQYLAQPIVLIPSDSLGKLIPREVLNRYLLMPVRRKPNRHLEIVHSHVYPSFIIWCRGLQKVGVKWIHTFHLPYFPEHSLGEMPQWHDEFNKAQFEIGRFADIRLSVSIWQKQYLKEHYDIDAIYIPNGVDVDACNKASSENFYRKTGLKNFILNVSRHDPVKNPGEFVLLAQRMPDLQFVMVGKGLSSEVLRDTYGVNVPNNLRIMGALKRQEALDAIAACCLLISTSKREGLPTLILESMALRKPIIVSDEPGSMEAIEGGRCGYFYALGDLDDLSKKVPLALEDLERPVLAQQRVLDEYDWRVVSRRLEVVYKRLNGNENYSR